MGWTSPDQHEDRSPKEGFSLSLTEPEPAQVPAYPMLEPPPCAVWARGQGHLPGAQPFGSS